MIDGAFVSAVDLNASAGLSQIKERMDAGAALAFAIYHCGDIDWIKAMPSHVAVAYMRAAKAYGCDSRRALEEFSRV
jgi:hypothetical protein